MQIEVDNGIAPHQDHYEKRMFSRNDVTVSGQLSDMEESIQNLVTSISTSDALIRGLTARVGRIENRGLMDQLHANTASVMALEQGDAIQLTVEPSCFDPGQAEEQMQGASENIPKSEQEHIKSSPKMAVLQVYLVVELAGIAEAAVSCGWCL